MTDEVRLEFIVAEGDLAREFAAWSRSNARNRRSRRRQCAPIGGSATILARSSNKLVHHR
jgi:hypothetical protein